MSVSKQRRNLAYGVSNPLQTLSPEPIVSSRAPKTTDKAEVGTIWVYKSTNQSYVLASIVANSATWTPLTVNAGATITTGNLTVASGNIVVTAGNIGITLGDLTLTDGDATLTKGDLLLTDGDATLTAGNLALTAGNIGITLGNITLTDGDVTLTEGDLELVLGDLNMADGDITLLSGFVRSTLLIADGDDAGTASATTFTNINEGTVSSGAGSIKMTTTNASDSTGFIKIYVGTDIKYIPYFDTHGTP